MSGDALCPGGLHEKWLRGKCGSKPLDLRRSGPHDEWSRGDVSVSVREYVPADVPRNSLHSRRRFLVSRLFWNCKLPHLDVRLSQVLASDWSWNAVWVQCECSASTGADGDLNKLALWRQLSVWKTNASAAMRDWVVQEQLKVAYWRINWWASGAALCERADPLDALANPSERIQSIAQSCCSQAVIQTHQSKCEEFGLI